MLNAAHRGALATSVAVQCDPGRVTRDLMDTQSQSTPAPIPYALPAVVPLAHYLPARRPFDWNGFKAESVNSGLDLPPYLSIGRLDPDSFIRTADGWSAILTCPRSLVQRYEGRVGSIVIVTVSTLAAAERRGAAPSAAAASRAA